jgi:hypothetical protein
MLTGSAMTMGKLSKNQQKRELMQADVSQSKQSTLDDLSFQFNITKTEETFKPAKEIIVDNISYTIKEDDLALKVEFSLLPSKTSFLKINLDLYFDDQLINSTTLCIPQSALLSDNLEFSQILDMKGIAAGNYLIRVEMYELWESSEKLCFSAKEIVVEYVPQSRESHLVKFPIVKSVAGNDLVVVSSSAKNIYREIEQDQKQEAISKRDEW